MCLTWSRLCDSALHQCIFAQQDVFGTLANDSQKYFKDYHITAKESRNIFTKAIYTTLNGGGHAGPTMSEYIKGVLVEAYQRAGKSIKQVDDDIASFLHIYDGIVKRVPFFKEVQELNDTLGNYKKGVYEVYTVDSTRPYEIESKHQAISRVTQSYEVLLLTILRQQLLINCYLPLILCHDGVLALSSIENDLENYIVFCDEFETRTKELLGLAFDLDVKKFFKPGMYSTPTMGDSLTDDFTEEDKRFLSKLGLLELEKGTSIYRRTKVGDKIANELISGSNENLEEHKDIIDSFIQYFTKTRGIKSIERKPKKRGRPRTKK